MFMNNTPPEMSTLDSSLCQSLEARAPDGSRNCGIRIWLDATNGQLYCSTNGAARQSVIGPVVSDGADRIAFDIVPANCAHRTSQFHQLPVAKVCCNAGGKDLNDAVRAIAARRMLCGSNFFLSFSGELRMVGFEGGTGR